ncbi:PDZ domain-containing protein [Actinomycetota bacterium]
MLKKSLLIISIIVLTISLLSMGAHCEQEGDAINLGGDLTGRSSVSTPKDEEDRADKSVVAITPEDIEIRCGLEKSYPYESFEISVESLLPDIEEDGIKFEFCSSGLEDTSDEGEEWYAEPILGNDVKYDFYIKYRNVDEGVKQLIPEQIEYKCNIENPRPGEKFEISVGILDPDIEIGDLSIVMSCREEVIAEAPCAPLFNPEGESVLGCSLSLSNEATEDAVEISWDIIISNVAESIILKPIPAESGSAVAGANTFNDGNNYIGDSDCDNSVFSFVSFDIVPLKGATVNKATLGLTIPNIATADNTQTIAAAGLTCALATSPTTSVPVRNSSDADVVGIGDNYMIDNDPANFGAFVGHIPPESIEDGNATLSDEELKNKLQENIDQELDRLVLAIATEDLYSNDNGISEVFLIEVVLDVECTMPETTISGAMQEIMGGIGALLTQDNEGRILVLESIADSPAYKAGIQEGDWFIGVGGADIQGKDINTVVDEIIGPIGTKVAITAVRSNQVLVFICTLEALPETEESQ